MEVAIVSGLSGAGRSTAAKCLEDLGWFVVDNLPAELIQTMVDLGARSRGAVTRIAVVVDVRSRAFTEDLAMVIRDLDSAGYRPRVLFLEADDASLIRRYEANRRQHPLQGAGRISDGLAAERALLGPLRDEADVVIDTTSTSVHDLRRRIETDFTAAPRSSTLTVVSFGFKYGLPLDADLVIDMRFLPNPFWIPELRELTGLDPAVSDYVLTQEGATEFLDRWLELFQLTGGGYQREGKRYLTVAVGCTGGKHRSVATAEEIGRRLRAGQQSAAVGEASDIRVSHRDLGRE
ncbi:RNase adapter RapZ [Nakamurella sp. A5-74]|uniref:RNase adapter RapZ n=1 Tax=Nakamurella sp. A5-74 TaxID=3158264 RepID=A0AAU8DVE6_9ACTN